MSEPKFIDMSHLQQVENYDPYSSDPLVDRLIGCCVERSEAGIIKYGQTMEDNNKKTLIEWVDDVQEELWDAMVYLEKLKAKLKQYGLGGVT